METTRTMKQRLIPGLGHEDTSLKFKPPLYCEVQELDSVLDCYSSRPQGHWPTRPKLVAPLSHYEACRRALEKLPETAEGEPAYLTVGDYLLATLRQVGSEAISDLELVLVEEK